MKPVQSFAGDDAVDLLQTKIAERASGQNADLLDDFVSWLTGQETDDRALPVLHAWYQMLEHVDFDLAGPAPDDIDDLLDRAEAQDRDTWERALQLFYVAFLQEERGQDIAVAERLNH